jgi:hypothetical protein
VIGVQTSPRLKQFIGIVHGLAIFAVLITDIATITRGCLLVLLILHASRMIIQLQKERYQVKYSTDFGWQLAENDNDFSSVTVLHSTVLIPMISFLHLKKLNGQQKMLLILPDMLANDVYRQLIVRLKTTVILLE